MPEYGSEHMKGTAFWWRHNIVLFISMDVFENGKSRNDLIKLGVSGDHLIWLKRILEVHSIACTERDGIMQIAHGGLIGYNNTY